MAAQLGIAIQNRSSPEMDYLHFGSFGLNACLQGMWKTPSYPRATRFRSHAPEPLMVWMCSERNRFTSSAHSS